MVDASYNDNMVGPESLYCRCSGFPKFDKKINEMYDINVSFSNRSIAIRPQFADVWFELDIQNTFLGLRTAFHLLCQVNLTRDFEKWP